MSIELKPLDERDRELIALLASGASVTDAAARCGLASATCYRRMRRPMFRAALVEARAENWKPVAEGLRDGALRAAQRLVFLAENAAQESTQVKAAVACIELGLKLRVIVDDAPREAALEALVEEAAPGGFDPQRGFSAHGNEDAHTEAE